MSRRRAPASHDWMPGQLTPRRGQGAPPPGFFKGNRTAQLRFEDEAGHYLLAFERYYDEDDPMVYDRRGEQPDSVLYEVEDFDGQPHKIFLTCLACVKAAAGPRLGWGVGMDRIRCELAPLVAECRRLDTPCRRVFRLPSDL